MEVPTELARSFLGSVLQPGAPTFDEVRRIHNGLVDRRPAQSSPVAGVLPTSLMLSGMPKRPVLRFAYAAAATTSRGVRWSTMAS